MSKKLEQFIAVIFILIILFLIFIYSNTTVRYYILSFHVFTFIMIGKYIYDQDEKLKRSITDKHKHARTDPMTEVHNRLGLKECGMEKWKDAIRNSSSLVAIFIDIDQFKTFNDTYGHLVGDNVIKETANVFKKCLRLETDMIVRYGGDEFILLLSDIEKKDVEKLLERIQKNIADIKIKPIDKNITLSFGVNYIRKVNKTYNMEKIIDDSDKALYAAKKRGGNQYIFYNE